MVKEGAGDSGGHLTRFLHAPTLFCDQAVRLSVRNVLQPRLIVPRMPRGGDNLAVLSVVPDTKHL